MTTEVQTYLSALESQTQELRDAGCTLQSGPGKFTIWDQPRDTKGRVTRGVFTGQNPIRGEGWITSLFGALEQFRISMGLKAHRGYDTDDNNMFQRPIFADLPGFVHWSGWNDGGGNIVVIDNGQMMMTEYVHMREPAHYKNGQPLRIGDWVERGQQIGNIGTTGKFSSGTHLHESRTWRGKRIDPLATLVPVITMETEKPEAVWTPGQKPTFHQIVHAAADAAWNSVQDSVAWLGEPEISFMPNGRDVIEMWPIYVRKSWNLPYTDDGRVLRGPEGGSWSEADHKEWLRSQ